MTSQQMVNLLKLVGTPRDGALLRFSLGSEYLKCAEFGPAIAHLNAAVEKDPAYSAAWKLLGKALAEHGRGDEALAAYRKGIEVAQARGDRQAARPLGYEDAKAYRARRLFRLGGAGSGRDILLLLWSRRGFSRAGRAYGSGPLPRARHGSDRVHHRARLQPGHRAVSHGRGRLPGRHALDRPLCGPRLGRRAHSRLRAHRLDFDRERGRCPVLAVSAPLPTIQACNRSRVHRGARAAQPAWDEGSDHGPAADLCRFHSHARVPDRVRRALPCDGAADSGPDVWRGTSELSAQLG